MVRRLAAAALALGISAAGAFAQPLPSPIPLYPGAAPPSIEPQPLPPVAPAGAAPSGPASPDQTTTATAASPASGDGPAARVFCGQPVAVRIAARDAVPQRYRRFLGMWSDASWTPQLCAALVVENVTPDGTATIAYAFGPMASTAPASGGVLHGTGIIRDGELRFQNSDGSQFAFRPLYADLAGRLTTPQGQSYEAIFKKTP